MIYLFAVALGAALPLSLAPFDWWPFGLVSIAGWFWLLTNSGGPAVTTRKSGSRRALMLGWTYGVGLFGTGVSWVYVSINVYGRASPALAAFLVAMFVAGMAVFPMVQAWFYTRLKGRGWLMNVLWFAAVWFAFEWLLTWFLTGFPWLYPGYAHLTTPLAGFAPVGGVSLVGLMAVLSACALVAAVGSRQRIRSVALALLPWVVGGALQSIEWVTPVGTRSVALVQGNVPQRVKWQPGRAAGIIRGYLDLTEPHWGVDVVVWPEAAVTLFEHQAGDVLAHLDERGKAAGSSVLLGMPTLIRTPDARTRIFNSALATGMGEGRYHKRRLVPFGDYVPLQGVFGEVMELFDLPLSSASAGDWVQAPLRLDDLSAALAICYEVVYAGLVRNSARDADVLVTISNDTWFGSSIGPFQHMQIARMRALENGRWMLRATNNGITAIVDHSGAVTGSLPQFEQGVLTGEFRVMQGHTLFNRWGDGYLVALCLLLLAVRLALRVTGGGESGHA
ncbi:MAG: apolipoprotein N-acyltransferase [Pseudomonadales bacterium]|nr:apolipoprotein N-acyltransferase [Pseudomonadales bacterium]MDP6470224.1 apolipoprotein N-acyltransferase [Pseudomonadales bacterium]MDP6827130.1 apolipoprotein N-acyltransferase [Pseudomonadales bacterium]MDP6971568.1 apolipoprotein N-acyltransferase [Pseudomonadales bacterium]